MGPNENQTPQSELELATKEESQKKKHPQGEGAF
jgi:hypothetical protein